MAVRKAKIGRPSKPVDQLQVQVAVRFPPTLIGRVDEFRLSRGDEPDRSAIIRELVAEALDRRVKKGKG